MSKLNLEILNARVMPALCVWNVTDDNNVHDASVAGNWANNERPNSDDDNIVIGGGKAEINWNINWNTFNNLTVLPNYAYAIKFPGNNTFKGTVDVEDTGLFFDSSATFEGAVTFKDVFVRTNWDGNLSDDMTFQGTVTLIDSVSLMGRVYNSGTMTLQDCWVNGDDNFIGLNTGTIKNADTNMDYSVFGPRIDNTGTLFTDSTGGTFMFLEVVDNTGGTITVRDGNMIFNGYSNSGNASYPYYSVEGGTVNVHSGAQLSLSSCLFLPAVLRAKDEGTAYVTGDVYIAGTLDVDDTPVTDLAISGYLGINGANIQIQLNYTTGAVNHINAWIVDVKATGTLTVYAIGPQTNGTWLYMTGSEGITGGTVATAPNPFTHMQDFDDAWLQLGDDDEEDYEDREPGGRE